MILRKEGMREFVGEISSNRQLHHNLVQLLGYSHRKAILVYNFMPNGSLDKFLYDANKPTTHSIEYKYYQR